MRLQGMMRAVIVLTGLLAVAAWGPAAAGPFAGFGGDGSFIYPDADIPTRWSATNNVVWKTAMPSWSNSQPTGGDGRIFAMSEPLDTGPILVCIDDADGSILWQREIDYLDAKTERGFSAYMAGLRDAMRRAHDTEKPDKAAWPRIPGELRAGGACLPAWGVGNKGAPNCTSFNWTGFAYPAPLTDGQHVWTWTFPGVASCFDRDGRLLWRRVFHPQKGKDPFRGGCTYTSAPVIVDGCLIVLGGNLLRGLDPATGETRWEQPLLERQGWSPRPPQALRVSGDGAVFCVDGGVYRARDGKLMQDMRRSKKVSDAGNDLAIEDDLFPGAVTGKEPEYPELLNVSGILAFDDNVFFGFKLGKRDHYSRCYRVERTGEDAWQATLRWEARARPGSAYGWPIPLRYDGTIYAAGGAIEVATGKADKNPFRAAMSRPIVCGKRLVARAKGQIGKKPPGWKGPECESYVRVYDIASRRELAMNALPWAPIAGMKREVILANSAKPHWQPNGLQTIFCMGDRLYIRTHDDVWCIGKHDGPPNIVSKANPFRGRLPVALVGSFGIGGERRLPELTIGLLSAGGYEAVGGRRGPVQPTVAAEWSKGSGRAHIRELKPKAVVVALNAADTGGDDKNAGLNEVLSQWKHHIAENGAQPFFAVCRDWALDKPPSAKRGEEMDALLYDWAERQAELGIETAPVALAWHRALEAMEAGKLNVGGAANKHEWQHAAKAYLSACVLAATITSRNPEFLPAPRDLLPEGADAGKTNPSARDLASLQRIAWWACVDWDRLTSAQGVAARKRADRLAEATAPDLSKTEKIAALLDLYRNDKALAEEAAAALMKMDSRLVLPLEGKQTRMAAPFPAQGVIVKASKPPDPASGDKAFVMTFHVKNLSFFGRPVGSGEAIVHVLAMHDGNVLSVAQRQPGDPLSAQYVSWPAVAGKYGNIPSSSLEDEKLTCRHFHFWAEVSGSPVPRDEP